MQWAKIAWWQIYLVSVSIAALGLALSPAKRVDGDVLMILVSPIGIYQGVMDADNMAATIVSFLGALLVVGLVIGKWANSGKSKRREPG
ncbi:MAG: hypothetical protein WD716_04315 [Fimbriimonadaceae bacterium]